MGIIQRPTEERSQLQQKLAADIAERQRARAKADDMPPDGVDDSQLIEGTSRMTRTGLALLVVLIAAISGIIIFVAIRP